MMKHLAIALAMGLGLGAGSVYAQEADRDLDRDEAIDDRGTDEKYREGEDAGRDRGIFGEKETLEEGVLKLSREDTAKIRQALVARGYTVEKAEADEGELEDVLKKFQKDVGIEETGDVDVASLNALGFSAIVCISPDVKGAELAKGHAPTVTERPAGMPLDAAVVGTGKDVLGFLVLGEDQIKEIQERLKDEGYYTGEPSGAVTPEFLEGLKKFQQAKGIKAAGAGVLDLSTLAWFPDADIDVEVTDEPEMEISEPRGGMQKPGTPDQHPERPQHQSQPR